MAGVGYYNGVGAVEDRLLSGQKVTNDILGSLFDTVMLWSPITARHINSCITHLHLEENRWFHRPYPIIGTHGFLSSPPCQNLLLSGPDRITYRVSARPESQRGIWARASTVWDVGYVIKFHPGLKLAMLSGP